MEFRVGVFLLLGASWIEGGKTKRNQLGGGSRRNPHPKQPALQVMTNLEVWWPVPDVSAAMRRLDKQGCASVDSIITAAFGRALKVGHKPFQGLRFTRSAGASAMRAALARPVGPLTCNREDAATAKFQSDVTVFPPHAKSTWSARQVHFKFCIVPQMEDQETWSKSLQNSNGCLHPLCRLA